MNKWLYIKNLLYYLWYKNYRVQIKSNKMRSGEVWYFEKGKILIRVMYRDGTRRELYNYYELIL